MKTLVLDESLDISPSIHRFLAARGAEGVFVCSAQELVMAEASQGPVGFRVVNLSSAITAWEVARHLKASAAACPTLVFFDSTAQGIEHLTALPGVECLERPRSAGELDSRLERVLGRATSGAAAVAGTPGSAVVSDIVGQSSEIRDVFAKIEKVAAGSANVCIVGESGTGKELIARAIHYNSDRRDRPLITLDCTAIPDGLMESHLFGHVRGSFTGAVENRDGVFSLAHTGTLFIDEISELSLAAPGQAPPCDPDARVRKVGGSKPIRTDIRLITASNKDLRRAVADGNFREDLYYRIAVVMIADSSPARSQGRRARARGSLPQEVQHRPPQAHPLGDPAGDGAPHELSMAGEHSPARELHRAGSGPV